MFNSQVFGQVYTTNSMLDSEAQKVHLRNLQEALGYLKNSVERRRQN